MKKLTVALSVLLILLLAGCTTTEHRKSPLPVVGNIPVLDRRPLFVGGLKDRVWKRALKVRLAENQKGTVVPRSSSTTAYLFRHGDILFVGFKCNDRDIWSTLKTKDGDLWREEAVEVFLDPDGSGREYLELEINPLGAVYDAWIKYSDNIDFNEAKKFDLENLKVSVEVHGDINESRLADKEWIVEVSIPLKNLPVQLSDSFRINLTRIETDRKTKKQKYSAWSPTYKWFHVPERFVPAKFVYVK